MIQKNLSKIALPLCDLRIQDNKTQYCLKLIQEDPTQFQTQPRPLHKLISWYHISDPIPGHILQQSEGQLN